jgi:hypothetical protein
MSQFAANALWGLKYGAMLALAFALGLGLAFVVQGPAAFAAYHPSMPDVLAGVVGTWLVGGLAIGIGRPLSRSSVGQLVLVVVGGVFVVFGVLGLVVGFSEVPVATALLGGVAVGLRFGIFRKPAAGLSTLEPSRMDLPAKYQHSLTRHQTKTVEDWNMIMGGWLEANEEPKLGFEFRLRDESSARALENRLRAAGAEFVAAERRPFAFWRPWMVCGYESAPAKRIEQVNSWIEKMVAVGAEYHANFHRWAPGRPVAAA